jgi:hypothetical protein
MNKADEGAINILQRKILRGIFGAIKERRSLEKKL